MDRDPPDRRTGLVESAAPGAGVVGTGRRPSRVPLSKSRGGSPDSRMPHPLPWAWPAQRPGPGERRTLSCLGMGGRLEAPSPPPPEALLRVQGSDRKQRRPGGATTAWASWEDPAPASRPPPVPSDAGPTGRGGLAMPRGPQQSGSRTCPKSGYLLFSGDQVTVGARVSPRHCAFSRGHACRTWAEGSGFLWARRKWPCADLDHQGRLQGSRVLGGVSADGPDLP